MLYFILVLIGQSYFRKNTLSHDSHHTQSQHKRFSFVLTSVGTFQTYILDCIEQIHRFHPLEKIYIAIDRASLPHFKRYQNETYVLVVCLEDIKTTDVHFRFNQTTHLNVSFREGFRRFTSERLFALYDLMSHYQLSNVIHMENDNLIYFSDSTYTLFW